MISLDKEQICLLELIKASLFNVTPAIPENVNWDKILDVAKIQCIVPMLTHCIPFEHRNSWNIITYQNKAFFMQMMYEQNALVELFKENKIPTVIIKGTAAAMYYPNPCMRTFGDIDFYVSPQYYTNAKRLLEKKDYRYITNNDRQIVYEKNGVEFELHEIISRKGSYDINSIVLSDSFTTVECSINGCSFPCLPTYYNGLVLLWHIMHHLKGSGIGIRQILDWMLFVHNELDDYAWNNYFKVLVVQTGLEKLAVTVTYMCKKWLGLPDDIIWCNKAEDEVADQLLVRILNDGNFGNERANYENVMKSMREEGTFKFLQRLGLSNWRLARKFVFLKPFAWLYQIFKYASIGFVQLISGKKVISKGKCSISLKELLKRIE